jgi:putative Holliday junction resolvase
MTEGDLRTLHGKRLCALDVGTKRIGVAVCDEMHILVSTRPVIANDDHVLETLRRRLADDRIEALVIGVPRLHDDRTTPIIAFIEAFVTKVRAEVSIPVFEADEAFSTQEARALMISGGTKKKKRQTKGVKDQMAAAVILRDVIEEVRALPQRPLP